MGAQNKWRVNHLAVEGCDGFPFSRCLLGCFYHAPCAGQLLVCWGKDTVGNGILGGWTL